MKNILPAFFACILALSGAAATISNGDPPDDARYEAVVALHLRAGASVDPAPFCSGTLIAESVVVTAAHCLDMAPPEEPDAIPIAPADLAVYFGCGPFGLEEIPPPTGCPDPGVVHTVEVLLHPDYDRLGSGVNDIGLIRLESCADCPPPMPPLPSELALTESDIGAPINFAGFGDDAAGSSGVKMQLDGVLGGFGCAVRGCPDPGNTDSQVSYEQGLQPGTCTGDSGGPLLYDFDGTRYVGGVTSWGDDNCLEFGVSLRVSAYDGWITDFLSPVVSTCGDGVIGAPEACDDGDETPGDGCDAICQIEPGWTCEGEPSVCTPLPVPSISFGGLALLGSLVLAIALGGLAVQRRRRAG